MKRGVIFAPNIEPLEAEIKAFNAHELTRVIIMLAEVKNNSFLKKFVFNGTLAGNEGRAL